MLVTGSGLQLSLCIFGEKGPDPGGKEGLHFKCFALECVFKMYLSCGLQRDVLGLVCIAQIEESDLFAFWHCKCRFVTCSVVSSGLAFSRRGRSSQLCLGAVCWQGKGQGQGQAGMTHGWHTP